MPSPIVEPILINTIDDGGEVASDPDDGGEVASDPDDGGEVASDPDDGGEIYQPVTVIDGLRDDFDAAVEGFHGTVGQLGGVDFSDVSGVPLELVNQSVEALLDDPLGVLNVQPSVSDMMTDAASSGEVLLSVDVAGASAGEQAAANDWVSPGPVEVIYEPVIEEVVDAVEQVGSDFVEEPLDAASDMADEAEGTVAGIADDIGL